jgi:hypothetical protein
MYCKDIGMEVEEDKSSILFHKTLLGQKMLFGYYYLYNKKIFNWASNTWFFDSRKMDMGLGTSYGYMEKSKVGYPLGILDGSLLGED